MPLVEWISASALGGLMPQLQQPDRFGTIPGWAWFLFFLLVVLVGVIWTLYEEEGLGITPDSSENSRE